MNIATFLAFDTNIIRTPTPNILYAPLVLSVCVCVEAAALGLPGAGPADPPAAGQGEAGPAANRGHPHTLHPCVSATTTGNRNLVFRHSVAINKF